MSLNNYKDQGIIEDGLPAHAVSFLYGMSVKITPINLQVVLPLIGEDAVEEFTKGYEGDNAQLLLAKSVLNNAAADLLITDRDKFLAGILNEVRCILRDEVSNTAEEETSPTGTAKPTVEVTKITSLPKTSDKRENRSYDCSKCAHPAYVADGISDLYLHLHNEHPERGTREFAARKLALLGHPDFQSGRSVPPNRQYAAPDLSGKPMFEPKYRLDISGLPDARYAIEDPITEKMVFLRKVTLKRGYTRRGRFNWGKTTRSWETIPAGTVEVRHQTGDTKKLFGEVRDGIYYGEMEDALQAILVNPEEAMLRYGELMKCCGYCGKSLTDKLSQDRRIGPDCWEEKHIPWKMYLMNQKILEIEAASMGVGS